MEYFEYKDLKDHLNSMAKYSTNDKTKYYELLLLKSIYDRLGFIEMPETKVGDLSYREVKMRD